MAAHGGPPCDIVPVRRKAPLPALISIGFDIHTLAIILGISRLLQFIALFTQYTLDKTHRGPGWCTVEHAVLALG